MKALSKILSAMSIIALFLTFTSCSDDDNNSGAPTPGPMSITETTQNTSDLSILVEALIKANLAQTLDDPGSFTVFAPTNQAFSKLLNDLGFDSLDDVPIEALTNILLNHVINGLNNSSSLTSGYINTLGIGAAGKNLSMYVDTSRGVVLNGISEVVTPDISASNGIIHIVDAVITPPTIVTFALADPNFTSLVAALTRNDLTFDYVTTLSTPDGTDPAPFTVFAPTNDAFGDLITELGISGLADISEPVLKATLDYHAVAGANVVSGDLTDDMTVSTLGGDITANVTGGATLTDANGRISNIIAVDVQAANGVIHAIDKVILPPLPEPLSITETAQNTSDLSILVEALTKANLAQTLDDPGSFTVFAPTNQAFTNLLNDLGFASLNDVPVDVLTNILLNHVVSGINESSSLTTGYVNTLATGPGGKNLSMYINTSGGVSLNGISNVTMPDISASNGVVHIVDAVITPPTIVTFALADPNFSTLVAALTRNDLTFDYVTALSTPDGSHPAPFTVFAPTNDAFGDLITELGISGLGDISEPVLKATLDHHAVAEMNVVSGDLMDAMTIHTLGGDITANITGGATLTDANGRISNIIAVDVQAANGVIHVIDKVILPPL